jgi:hypothetical protein
LLGLSTLLLLLPLLALMGCKGEADQQDQATADERGDEIEGALDGFDAAGIHGWAWDPKRPNTPIQVDIYDGDTKLATVLADELRDDLVKEKYGNGKHAFTYPIPAKLKDGKAHPIRLLSPDSGEELENSPQTFKSP